MKKQPKKIIALLVMFVMAFLVLSSRGEGAKAEAAAINTKPYVANDKNTVTFVHTSGVETTTVTKTVTGTEEWNLNLKNNSTSNMTFKITFTFNKKSGQRRPTVTSLASDWGDINTTNTNPFSPKAFNVKKGESYPIRVYYSGTYTGTTDVTATITATARKDFPTTGNTEETAVKVNWGSTLEGPCTGTKKYYTFTLAQPADVIIKESITEGSKRTDLNLYEKGRYDYKEDTHAITNGNEKKYPLGAGTYYIEVCTYSETASDTLNEYGLTITKADYKWPVPTVKWTNTVTQGDRSYNLSCSIPNDGTKTEILGWSLNNSNGNYDNFIGLGKKSFNDTYSIRATDHGWYKLEIQLRHEKYGRKIYSYDLRVNLQSPGHISASNFNSITNKIYLKNLKSNARYKSDYYRVEMYKSGRWQILSSRVTNSYTISGLKPCTSYKIRVRAYDAKKANYKSDLVSSAREFTIATGVTTKPVVKKVSVSKAKQYKVPKKWVSGYLSPGGYYHKGYYTGGYYETKYKVTVTLKKKIRNTSGLAINHGGTEYRVKGKGTKFSFWVVRRGKCIGKKTPSIKVRTYRNASYGGYGPYSSSKKTKIKK